MTGPHRIRDVRLHLSDAAVVGVQPIKVINFVTCVGKAVPAKFILADDAGHVIAAFILFDPRLAHRTLLHCQDSFLVCPSSHLSIHSLVTCPPFVNGFPALEASFTTAGSARDLLSVN
jgi:hypothetical protein